MHGALRALDDPANATTITIPIPECALGSSARPALCGRRAGLPSSPTDAPFDLREIVGGDPQRRRDASMAEPDAQLNATVDPSLQRDVSDPLPGVQSRSR